MIARVWLKLSGNEGRCQAETVKVYRAIARCWEYRRHVLNSGISGPDLRHNCHASGMANGYAAPIAHSAEVGVHGEDHP